ncbi:hypothetical protein JCM16358_23290 [Halanaerocella petrolearia]
MKIEEMNQGAKIPYTVDETNKTITFDGQITVGLTEEQGNIEQVVDIGLDKNRNLIKDSGKWYIANIVIPGIEHKLVDTGEVDEDGNKVFEKVQKELNLDDVELALWNLPSIYNNNNGGIE